MEQYISDFLMVLRDNLKTIIKGDYERGRVDLNTLGNVALTRLEHCGVLPDTRSLPELTREQKRQIRAFYAPYVRLHGLRHHRLYTACSGKFSPAYLPEDLWLTQVDRYFCDREEARYLDHKCYYYRLFSNVKQPELIVMRIGNTWLGSDLRPVPKAEAASLLRSEKEAVVKRAVNSEGGFGVQFLKGKELAAEFDCFFGKIPCDVVVQRPVRQHPALAALHPSSVNTMRIVSMLTEERVKIYKVCLKIGTGDSRIDNGWGGGVFCGVKPDGTLFPYGADHNGRRLTHHPDLGYAFAGQRVPHLRKALRLVRDAHAMMGHFRVISWDVTIDEKGEAVLIEANLTLGGINMVQMSSGPLFGRDTRNILDEVFRSSSGKK